MRETNKILVVDDDAMQRWTLTQALQEWGYDTLEAETTNAGLVQFEQVHPAVVLLDIGLPDGSGLDLLHQIKRRRPNTAVIMMTGEVVVENTIAALRGGADDFVAKPIHLDELQFALKRALKTQRRTGTVFVLPRLLIVTDSRMRANHLLTALRTTDIEVTVASTPAELARATEDEHDLVAVDVGATELRGVLAALRASPAHAEVPILVEISRVAHAHDISGVMPQYRAMPCSPTELVTLARRRIASVTAPS
jgi:DNA-binding response OmpR family regulator